MKFVAHDVSHLIAIGSSNGVEIWDYSKKVGFYVGNFSVMAESLRDYWCFTMELKQSCELSNTNI